MKKSEARKIFTTAIKGVAAGHKTSWKPKDSAEVAISILKQHPGRNGGPLEINESKAASIARIFDATALQLAALDEELKEICDLAPTVRDQLTLLLDPEEARKQLRDMGFLRKQTRGNSLKNLIQTDDDEQE